MDDNVQTEIVPNDKRFRDLVGETLAQIEERITSELYAIDFEEGEEEGYTTETEVRVLEWLQESIKIMNLKNLNPQNILFSKYRSNSQDQISPNFEDELIMQVDRDGHHTMENGICDVFQDNAVYRDEKIRSAFACLGFKDITWHNNESPSFGIEFETDEKYLTLWIIDSDGIGNSFKNRYHLMLCLEDWKEATSFEILELSLGIAWDEMISILLSNKEIMNLEWLEENFLIDFSEELANCIYSLDDIVGEAQRGKLTFENLKSSINAMSKHLDKFEKDANQNIYGSDVWEGEK